MDCGIGREFWFLHILSLLFFLFWTRPNWLSYFYNLLFFSLSLGNTNGVGLDIKSFANLGTLYLHTINGRTVQYIHTHYLRRTSIRRMMI